MNSNLLFQPVSGNENCYRGVLISFSFEGVCKLLNTDLNKFTNKVMHIESVMGNDGKKLVDLISKSATQSEKEHILNRFFKTLLDRKKNS
ncbi:hypothetical protein BZG02_20010 [Labilibaculum filiforme]|uniref:Uncharacterized protein n=1 Tax=Labilibaculum filiforme TaxID=1940526 RepID=A0A2N3HQD6_9BACT|nr:hypothetical protein BZG02_20010 [Labilibaculum filiforme]